MAKSGTFEEHQPLVVFIAIDNHSQFIAVIFHFCIGL
tara:strand:+ start:515 stop:625 length:111 start_codon:yes stop_codon:yes gene_type:complete